MRVFALLLLLVSTDLAQAQSPQELFAKGDYAAAASAARDLNSAAGDALAARATLTRAAHFIADRAQAEALIETALADARRGQARDAKLLEPVLQEGIALGYRAKLQQSPKVAKLAKMLFDKSFAMAPRDAFAALSLGAWNGEPIADLGGFISRTVLGAKEDQALYHYELAQKLAPQNPVIPIFYAFNIYRIDAKKYGARARQLLETALKLKAEDAYGAYMQKNARAVLSAMQSEDAKTTTRLIRLTQPFGQILVKK